MCCVWEEAYGLLDHAQYYLLVPGRRLHGSWMASVSEVSLGIFVALVVIRLAAGEEGG